MPLFRVKSVKFTPARKIYTDGVSRVSDNYQVCLVPKATEATTDPDVMTN